MGFTSESGLPIRASENTAPPSRRGKPGTIAISFIRTVTGRLWLCTNLLTRCRLAQAQGARGLLRCSQTPPVGIFTPPLRTLPAREGRHGHYGLYFRAAGLLPLPLPQMSRQELLRIP